MQAFAQAAEGQLHVPGLGFGAAVEVQAEAGGDVERPDQRHRQPAGDIHAQLHPWRRPCQHHPPERAHRVGQQVGGNGDEHRRQHAQGQRELEQPAGPGQQRALRIGGTADHAPARTALRGGGAFEHVHRHQQRAGQREPAPQQVACQRVATEPPLRAQDLRGGGAGAEHAAREHVQRDAVERRLEPPQQHRRQPEQVRPPGQRVEQRQHRQRGQQPRPPDRAGVAAQQRGAQFHRFPRGSRAQGDIEVFRTHRRPPPGVRPGRRATASRSPPATAPPIRRTCPRPGPTGSRTRTPRRTRPAAASP